MKKFFSAQVLVFVLFGVMTAGEPPRRVVVLQTSDLHARLHATDEHGGWLQAASVIRAERERAGRENILVVDCGDSVQGAPFGFVTRGKGPMRALELMGTDVWVPGNHEFDYGLSVFKDLVESAKIPVLNGNIRVQGLKMPGHEQNRIPAFRIFERAGVRIAVIGLNTPYLKHWFSSLEFDDLQVESAFRTVEEVMPDVQAERPHVIILAIHQGFIPGKKILPGEVLEIAKGFPQIDLILGGHTHIGCDGRTIAGAHFVQTEEHGSHVARVLIDVDPQKRRVTRIQSALIATKDEKPDAIFLRELKPFLDQEREWSSTYVSTLKHDVKARGIPGKDNAMSELIAAAIAKGSGADVVFHGTLSGYELRKGPVVNANLFAAVPFDNRIGVCDLSREQLIAVMNEQLGYVDSYNMQGPYGLTFTIDWRQKKVTDLQLPNGAQSMTCAFNSYVLAGGGDRFRVLRKIVQQPDVRLRELKLETRDLLRNYLREHDPPPPRAWLQ